MDWRAVLGPAALIPLVNAGVRLSMPTALAAVGETFSQRAGVLNLGLEGMMLGGALSSFLVTYTTGQLWLGVLSGMAAGLALGALMAFLSVRLKTEQVINGIAIVLLGQGITTFGYQRIFGVTANPPQITPPKPLQIPLLGRIPGVGAVLFHQDWLFYFAIALAGLVWWLLFRTKFGLSVRAVGESPSAADAAAIPVDRIRWLGLLVCGLLTGLGGAIVAIELGVFVPNVTAGRGWVALALVIFGRWNPPYVMGGALLFGLTNALQLRIQAAGGGIGTSVPYEVFQALPYVVTVAVMAAATIRAKRDAQPAALGTVFRKEVAE
jgi:general nucleoside transport system permease protein